MRRILLVLIIMAATGVTAPQVLEWLGKAARTVVQEVWPYLQGLTSSLSGPAGL